MSTFGYSRMIDQTRATDTGYKNNCKAELFHQAIRNGAITDGCTIEYTEVDMRPLGIELRLRISTPDTCPIHIYEATGECFPLGTIIYHADQVTIDEQTPDPDAV